MPFPGFYANWNQRVSSKKAVGQSKNGYKVDKEAKSSKIIN
jgi:hypothetical protein